MIILLAYLWAGMLVFVALGGYAYGWWWRGKHEAKRRAEREVELRKELEWARREERELMRQIGPPQLRVVE